MAQTRPILLTVQSNSTGESHEIDGETFKTNENESQKSATRPSATCTTIKSALKHRDLRTPSPTPHADGGHSASASASGSASASPCTESNLVHHMELQSPFEDGDYIKKFLSSAASRPTVRFGEECAHENTIDVRLDDRETISVHVGYLQLESAYTVDFAIPAELLIQAWSKQQEHQQQNQEAADTNAAAVAVAETIASDDVEQFLHAWHVEHVFGKAAKLLSTNVDQANRSVLFQFEFHANKEKIVAQRFSLAYQPKVSGEQANNSGPLHRVNVVLVCRVFPRTKGTALLRDGVHLISHSHARKVSNVAHSAPDTLLTTTLTNLVVTTETNGQAETTKLAVEAPLLVAQQQP